MSAVEIYLAKDEMEASIIKGNLESSGIKSTINPINNDSPLNGLDGAQNIPYGVYVEKDMEEEAKKVLAERK